MENMSWEVIDAIVDSYRDDEELVANCLYYLYKTTTDIKIASQIQDTFEDMNYCIDCGHKLMERTIEEHHTELDGNPIEYLTELFCPNCD